MAILFAGIFYVLAGFYLYHTRGHYHFHITRYTFLYFLCAAAIVPRFKSLSQFNRSPSGILVTQALGLLFTISTILFLSLLLYDPKLIYSVPSQVGLYFRQTQIILIMFAFLVFLTWSTSTYWKNSDKSVVLLKTFKIIASVMIGLLLWIQLLIPSYSPHPIIDVFAWNSSAVDFFLSGKNPYTQTYADINHGVYSIKPAFVYFPGILFWLAPFKAAFGDVRFGFIAAQCLTVFSQFRIVRRRAIDSTSMTFAWLLPIIWLTFPVTYFVLEQSWIDTLLITITFLIVDAMDLRRWNWAGILLGLVFTMKQYAFVISFFALLRIWQLTDFRQAVKSFFLGVVSFGAIVFPFAYWDWQSFIEMTIRSHTNASIRLDSLGMTAFMSRKWGIVFPRSAQIAVTALGLLLGIAAILKDPLKKMDRLASALFLSYGCAFLFGQWAFCNYHYLLFSFLLLYLATAVPDSHLV